MGLDELCSSGKCGLCCFFPKADFNDPFKVWRVGLLVNNCYKSVDQYNKINSNDLEGFIKKYANKLVREGNSFYIKLNKDVARQNKNGFNSSHPCAFLELKINEENQTIESLKCMIYPENGEVDMRPAQCINHPINFLCVLNKDRFDCIIINCKEYKLTF